ncbi:MULTISPECIES: gamma-glutamylcyclotransferase [Pseudomonas]|uniref:glutathione-specific gamma-glutamylcyclotransferase n=1 Tax=Pseudomonas fluorescens R124 TaxID=743713 RepID=A0A7U9CNU4_PSEFL|nr:MULTISPECIES: gamma-glutamylcyclotransferase [Pseudomonas]EJZ58826.1 hypothetical protein I1A_003157 [Pseudomonas fluorescens R124]MCU1775038.1 gamma-glutamylcyclotransferase [Pseudomonas sp. 13B_3.2_Bac1]RBC01451.1 gamma-glutamylcyclotransferase [Pseudomonas sp. MWU12-2115]RBL72776.1 gamma-glutamylcyclotransferase [Pseudomonas sp. MWU13-2625]
MLTKQLISSGAYLEKFSDVPPELLWTLERIGQSMEDTLNARPGEGDIWVFGYGSLIWNPLFEFAEHQLATLHGWHRSFCLRMIAGRATVALPGRMLALQRGGETHGVAFKISQAVARDELISLWIREMPTGAYRPIWTGVQLADGRDVLALVFVADPDHPLFEADARIETIAGSVALAEGPMGTNADYVHRLCCALSESGIVDEYIGALSAELMD